MEARGSFLNQNHLFSYFNSEMYNFVCLLGLQLLHFDNYSVVMGYMGAHCSASVQL